MGNSNVFAELTPEDIITPPACTNLQYLRDNPQEAVRATVDGLFNMLTKGIAETRIWRSLSNLSQRALEDAYDGSPNRTHPATTACLIRRQLLQPNGAITLRGKQVVHEARDNALCYRRAVCSQRAENQQQCITYGIDPGCGCGIYWHANGCTCDCHRLLRITEAPQVVTT